MKKLILLLVFGIFLISFVYAEISFTPIFCNDYEFTGCYAEESTLYPQITDEKSWSCPEYASKCEVISTGGEDWYIGFGNCHTKTGICNKWECDSQSPGQVEMFPGNQIYLSSSCLNPNITAEIKIIKPVLKFSGTACGAGGTPISGADGCTFTPNENIIYPSDNMENKIETTSYTVPLTTPSPTCVMSWVSGNRHICGYKEESCSSDSNCEGHTFGNKECTGKTLQTYGCKSYGTELGELTEISGGLLNLGGDTAGINEDISQPSSGNANFGKRCEITTSKNVQCCGDTDCGSGMFCDTSTFTCQEEAECNENSDCGVSVQCDWTTNLLKTPSCKSGKCKYEEKEVGCCIDKNCEEGSFCNEKKECELGSKTKTGAKESNNPSGITGASIGTNKSPSLWIGIIIAVVLIGGGLAFFLNKNKEKSNSSSNGKCCENSKREGKKFCVKCGKKL